MFRYLSGGDNSEDPPTTRTTYRGGEQTKLELDVCANLSEL